MKKLIGFTLTGISLLSWFLYTQNNRIGTTAFSFYSKRLPKSFNGLKIVHLSDLHNKTFPKRQYSLIYKIKQAMPDMIVITGDIIDARRYDNKPCLLLVQKLVKIAPVYYVTGNHEAKSGEFKQFEIYLRQTGVYVLRNETTIFNKQNEHVLITGIDDPSFATDFPDSDDTLFMMQAIEAAQQDVQIHQDFRILLSHRPEKLSLYTNHQFDIVFSGQAHGGQIRLPFFGGLIAPHQGFFPDFTEGVHRHDHTLMVINRGLGNSLFPFRIFNRPEIIALTLMREE